MIPAYFQFCLGALEVIEVSVGIAEIEANWETSSLSVEDLSE